MPSLTTLLQTHRIRTILSAIGRTPPPNPQLALIDAPKAAGVTRFLPADFGSDYDAMPRDAPLFDSFAKPKIDIREAVKASGLEWTFIANGWFAEVLFGLPFMGVDLKARTVSAPVFFDTTASVTALKDIVRLTAAVLIDPANINRQLYFRPTVHIRADRAGAGAATGDKVTRKVWPKKEFEAVIASKPLDMAARCAAIPAGRRPLVPRGGDLQERRVHEHIAGDGDADVGRPPAAQTSTLIGTEGNWRGARESCLRWFSVLPNQHSGYIAQKCVSI